MQGNPGQSRRRGDAPDGRWVARAAWAAGLALVLGACGSGPANYEGVNGGLLPFAGALRPPEGYANRGLTRPADAATILEGRQVFAVTCAACHGPEMRGRGVSGVNLWPHPADLRAPHLGNLTDGELYGYIAEGVHGTGMPAWKLVLTPAQMQAAARYVRSQQLVVPADARTNPVP
ncbi:MAG TPA: cytochrome c, partial [Deinococcales bacterium]|nr:cytochrome c [Deinococcales bacterium]